MSAIWGVVSLRHEEIMDGTISRMQSAYDKYKIDRVESIEKDNVLMGCGIQYFTEESRYEKLPVVEDNVFYAADVVLDNREELLEDLNIQQETVIADGQILYYTYKKYGKKCLNKLRGAYAFVYYDKQENAIYVVSDAAGTRCLYYRYVDGMFSFSTVMEALWQPNEKRKMNERWLVDFLALDNLVGLTECKETMYEGIYKLEPAQILKITISGIEEENYWNPAPKELKLKTDEEYKEKFIELLGDSVRCLLRADKTAMFLSGGLDSSSIACFAAPELKKRGKKLYAFTSVPEQDYVSDASSYYVTNESTAAKKTGEFLGNVENYWIELKGEDPWSVREKIREGFEIPYKSPRNMQWIIKGMEEAAALGARIMLEGSYGNVNISFGNPQIYFNTLLSQKRFISYFSEMGYYAKNYGWSRKEKIKMLLKTAKIYYSRNKKEQKDVLGKAFIKKDIIEKYDLETRISELYETRTENKMDVKSNSKLMIDKLQLSYKGEINTKESLMTGVLSRDPCRDKRLIEFCMSLPVEQYCYRGVSRRLVREYLEGIVPEHVIKGERYGCQSADMLCGVRKKWNKIYSEMKDIFVRNQKHDFVECIDALKELERLNQNILACDSFDFIRLFYTSMLLETMEGQ